MSLELNTRIGDPTKLGRDCEIHQHKQVKYTFIICYIRMIVFVDIIQILMFYNDISFSHWFPDDRIQPTVDLWTPTLSTIDIFFSFRMELFNTCLFGWNGVRHG